MKKYIALLDILGFKDLINGNEHDFLVQLFSQLPVYIEGAISRNKTMKSEDGKVHYDAKNGEINSIIISDTIVLWTNNTSTESFFELVKCTQRLLVFCHNKPFLFLRGGITIGELYYNNPGIVNSNNNTFTNHSIIFGKGLVKAYEMEKELDIAGCVIDNDAWQSAFKRNPEQFNRKWQEIISDKIIMSYEPPFKENCKLNFKDAKVESWMVNWVLDGLNPSRKEINAGFTTLNRKADRKDVKKKIRNTLDFFRHVKQKNIKNRND